MYPKVARTLGNRCHQVVPAGCDRARRQDARCRLYVFQAVVDVSFSVTALPEQLGGLSVHGGNGVPLQALGPLVVLATEVRYEHLHRKRSCLVRLVDEMRVVTVRPIAAPATRSEEHTSELQSLMRISYAVFCLKKKHI